MTANTPARRHWQKLTDTQRRQAREHTIANLPPAMLNRLNHHPIGWPDWAEALAIDNAYRTHTGRKDVA